VQVSELERIAIQCRDRGDTRLYGELGRVIYQTGRMNLNLVELLSLYKLGKAIYPVDIDEYAVADVLHEAVMQNQFMLELKGITVTTDCAPDCYWYLDRDLIKGVLVNALNNAFHHTADAIHLSARTHNKLLEIRVEDNGPGYPEEMLKDGHLNAGRTVNFDTGSTGLGLYFSSQVAGLHKNGKNAAHCRLKWRHPGWRVFYADAALEAGRELEQYDAFVATSQHPHH